MDLKDLLSFDWLYRIAEHKVSFNLNIQYK